jgi:hypothetical protein
MMQPNAYSPALAVARHRAAGWAELLLVTGLLERPNVYALPAALPLLRLGETIYREPLPLLSDQRIGLSRRHVAARGNGADSPA